MLVSVRMAHLQKVLILKPVVSIYFRCFYLYAKIILIKNDNKKNIRYRIKRKVEKRIKINFPTLNFY